MIRFAIYALMFLIFLLPSAVCANWPASGVPVGSGLIVSDGAAGAIVIRGAGSAGSFDLYVQRIDASGTLLWGSGVAICTAAGNQYASDMIQDGAGGYIVTWYDERSGSTNRDIYAQRIDASGVVQWTADGVALCTASNHQQVPRLVSDGAGGAIVTWYDLRGGGPPPLSYDVYAQRVDASGVVQWTANGVAISTATNDQWHPMIASDGAGGAIITWPDRRPGSIYDVYAQRISALGAVQWTANGVAVCTATNNQLVPTIIADGIGGAIITWEDSRGADIDIYAQRIDASGVAQWTANGLALCTAATNQTQALFNTVQSDPIVSDGSGGAIVAWWDGRNGTNDIYAQRVDPTGAVQWAIDGIAICLAAGGQNTSVIDTDGNGGAIIAWRDARSGNANVYAQRVDASGAVQWTADGAMLSPIVLTTASPAIAADGDGGAIVVYENSLFGYYAQRVGPEGTIPTAIGNTPPASAVALNPNRPNPFSDRTVMDIELPADSDVAVDVFDVAGRRVRELHLGHMGAGARTIQFDGRDAKGQALPSGVYFYRVTASGTTTTRKMVIAR